MQNETGVADRRLLDTTNDYSVGGILFATEFTEDTVDRGHGEEGY